MEHVLAGRSRHILGLMAGTSADGIDAALVRIDGTGADMRVRLVLHRHRAFPPRLRGRLLAAMAPAETTTQELARLHADLGEAFADAAARAIRAAGPVERPVAIGLAGQTVCHLPDSRRGRTVTLQLGEPARVAARTGVPVVAEFRQSDVAAGGQGAPLVPWTDWVLFRDPVTPRAVQNIGGIGNVTWLPPGAGPSQVVAFDTGPGNMIIDGLVASITAGRQRMDVDGRRAAGGRVLTDVLERWLAHPFLKQRPPKSTGRETFGREFIDREWLRLRRASRRPEDWVATATAFTARSISQSYRRFLPDLTARCLRLPIASGDAAEPCRAAAHQEQRVTGRRHGAAPLRTRVGKPADGRPELVVCGGGSLNGALLAMLAAELPGMTVRTIDSFGIPTQAKEAISFAMLAAARLDGVEANLPQVTGARRPVIMGQLVSAVYK